jgi:hypothetical protein
MNFPSTSEKFPGVKPVKPAQTVESKKSEDDDTGKDKSQEDIMQSDLHVKMRKFLERYEMSLADLNELFYKEGEAFSPLYEDLKTSKASESQIRVGLLSALNNALSSGDFEFDGEAVRKECVTRKCYDSGNFSKIFNNSAVLYDGFTAYSKDSSTVRLSEEGKKKLAQVMKELQ